MNLLEFCNTYSLSYKGIRRLISAGKFKATKTTKDVIVDPSEIDLMETLIHNEVFFLDYISQPGFNRVSFVFPRKCTALLEERTSFLNPLMYPYSKVTIASRLEAYITRITEHPKCPVCGEHVKWNTKNSKFNMFCSTECFKSETGFEYAMKKYRKTRRAWTHDRLLDSLKSRNFKILSSNEEVLSEKHFSIQCVNCSNVYSVSNNKDDMKYRGYTSWDFVCPVCCTKSQSAGELNLLGFIETLGLRYEHHHILYDKDNPLYGVNKIEIDIFLPDFNYGIEYHGSYWHSEKALYYKYEKRILAGKIDPEVVKNYHFIKYKMCTDNKIDLLQVYDFEWSNKQDIVKNIIKNKLGLLDSSINPASCTITPVELEEAIPFINQCHVKGYSPHADEIFLGLKRNDKLLSMVHLAPVGKGFELVRYMNTLGYTISGGVNILLQYFINHHPNVPIFANNDLRLHSGSGLQALGFQQSHILPPKEIYISSGKKCLKTFDAGSMEYILH